MPDDPNIWSQSIPQIQDGDPVNAATANAATNRLIERQNALKTLVDSLSSGERLLRRNARLSSDVEAGNMVYLDTDDLYHHLTEPGWKDPALTQGRLLPLESGIYTGLVLEKDTTSSGTILMQGLGTLETAELVQLFGTATPTPGVYYLDPVTPGQVTDTLPNIAVRAVQYLGNGLVHLFPFDQAPEGHTHKHYRLQMENWATAGLLPGAPLGAQYGYDLASAEALAQNLSEVILPYIGEGSFVYVLDLPAPGSGSSSATSSIPVPSPGSEIGKHVDPQNIRITSTGIWWYSATPPQNDIELTVTNAEAKSVSFLRTAESLTPHLKATVVNGLLQMSLDNFTNVNPNNAAAIAIKSLSENRYTTGPVLIGAASGIGIQASVVDGIVTFQLAEVALKPIPAQVVNLNNVITLPDGSFVFWEFPAGKTSNLAATFQLPYMDDPSLYEFYVQGVFRGAGTLQTAPTVSDAYSLGTGLAAGVTPSALGALGTFDDVPADDTKYYTFQAPTAIDGAGLSTGQVALTLTATNPTTRILLQSLSLVAVLK